jgi:hypothetical protein
MTATKTTTVATKTVQPPTQAVALDAHWAAKMQKLRDRQLAETTFVVCDDVDIKTRYDRAVRAQQTAQAVLKASSTDDAEAQKDADTADAELAQAKTAYDEASIPIRFRALPRPALEALYKAHKPSEQQIEDGEEWGTGFYAALISAASVDGMSEADAQELLDAWSLAEANAMFNAAMGVQSTTRSDLGKG